MAKKSDHIAGFDDDSTGGLLSGLLAEEDTFDRRALWRLGSWGVAAVAAVVVAVMANQAHLGLRREHMATADLVQQANRLQAATRESQNEARRLAAAVDTLNGDRDRLYSRVTMLEQGLDSVTGTIAKVAALPAPQVDTATASATATAPAVAPVTTTAAASPPAKAAPSAEAAPANVASIVKDVATKPAATPTAPLVEAKSMMGPPDPAAGKLIAPTRPASSVTAEPILPVMAAAPANESAESESSSAAAEASLPKVRRTEFGVDVGGANSIPGLRALWRGLLKSRVNAPLAALQPIIVIREGTGGRGMQLRLVAGPLSDAATAAKLCAALSENDRDCTTAVYEGQRLTVKAEDMPAPAKPAAAPARVRNTSKRAAVEAPKRIETSSNWTSFFGKKGAQ